MKRSSNAICQAPGSVLEAFIEQQRIDDWASVGKWADIGEPWIRLSYGTGDMIALSGAARELGKRYGKISLPCTRRDETNVRSFFVHCPEIEVIPLSHVDRVFNDQGLTTPGMGLVVAFETILPRDSKVDYYEHVYQSFGIDYEKRWIDCPIEEAAWAVEQISPPEHDYIFVHGDPRRNIIVDEAKVKQCGTIYENSLPVIFPEYRQHRSILAYANIIQNARAIHVADSAFFWMVEHIGKITGKLFLHRYGRTFLDVWQDYKRKQNWTIVL